MFETEHIMLSSKIITFTNILSKLQYQKRSFNQLFNVCFNVVRKYYVMINMIGDKTTTVY